MNRRRRYFLGLLSAPLFGSAIAEPDRPEDAAVWVAYIRQALHDFDGVGVIVVETDSLDVSNSEFGLKSWEQLQKVLPAIRRSTAIDLLAQSKQKRVVGFPTEEENLPLRILQARTAEIDRMFNTKERLDLQWGKLRKKFQGAGAFVRFSNVGYSEDFGQAAFAIGTRCGALCGNGVLVLLKRTISGWQVVKAEQAWIS